MNDHQPETLADACQRFRDACADLGRAIADSPVGHLAAPIVRGVLDGLNWLGRRCWW